MQIINIYIRSYNNNLLNLKDVDCKIAKQKKKIKLKKVNSKPKQKG